MGSRNPDGAHAGLVAAAVAAAAAAACAASVLPCARRCRLKQRKEEDDAPIDNEVKTALVFVMAPSRGWPSVGFGPFSGFWFIVETCLFPWASRLDRGREVDDDGLGGLRA
jgi:hypothetical protein